MARRSRSPYRWLALAQRLPSRSPRQERCRKCPTEKTDRGARSAAAPPRCCLHPPREERGRMTGSLRHSPWRSVSSRTRRD
eukprot:scaffold8556_cov286-Pinguiococcus_pyrenoidosus.AAC.18